MNHFNCIYCYTNKLNNKKYIGQTTNFNRRNREHLGTIKLKGKEYNKPFYNALKKYGKENFNVAILKESLQTKCLMNLYEFYYIKRYDTLAKNGKGYNISDGGDGGNPLSGKTEEELKEIFAKRSASMTGKMVGEKNPMYGRVFTEEERKRISERNTGERNPFYDKKHGKETKRRLSEAHKDKFPKGMHPNCGIPKTEEQKRKISETLKSKPRKTKIAQYSLEGELIRVWQDHEKPNEEGFDMYGIRLCFHGKLNSSQGFIWKEVNTNEDVIPELKTREFSKKIVQYEKNGEPIRIWSSLKQIQIELSFRKSSIVSCCKGEYKTACGYKWRYFKDLTDEEVKYLAELESKYSK